MKKTIKKIIYWIKKHKAWSLIFLLLLVGGGYASAKTLKHKDQGTQYVLGSVTRGNLISSVTGTGQVSVSDQVDIKPTVSGKLISLNAKEGQSVASGALIGQIDSRDAQYDLETAKLSYESLTTVDPTDLQNAQDDLTNVYSDIDSGLDSSETTMNDVMSGVDSIITKYFGPVYNYDISQKSKDYIQRAQSAYYESNNLLYSFNQKYRTLSVNTSRADLEAMLSAASTVASSVAQTAKYTQDAITFIQNQETGPAVTTIAPAYSTITDLVSKVNSTVSNILTLQSSLKTAQQKLDKLKSGPDALSLRSSQLSVQQKAAALSDYDIRAPFAGVLASVDAKKGDTVTNGTSIATLITKQKIAEISLNEIDAAKVQVGQKATLTFDAFSDLTISGKVVEVDMLGTVNQGVVNYTVKIAFDTDDDRIKPGMTVTADIITDMKTDVLTVPLSAVKTQGDSSYVDVVSGNIAPSNGSTPVTLSQPPVQTPVTTGISNDDSIEIVSGLQEGEQYVVRTVVSTKNATATTQSSAPSLFQRQGSGSRPANASLNRSFTR